MNIHVPHQNDERIPIHLVEIWRDNCGECSQKICCTIFDIVDEKNQWRDITVIKSGGKTCDHLAESWECSIYKERIHHRGYAKSCHNFSCSGIGPLIDRWTIRNNINIRVDSEKLTYIFQKMMALKIACKKNDLELESILQNSENVDSLRKLLFEE